MYLKLVITGGFICTFEEVIYDPFGGYGLMVGDTYFNVSVTNDIEIGVPYHQPIPSKKVLNDPLKGTNQSPSKYQLQIHNSAPPYLTPAPS